MAATRYLSEAVRTGDQRPPQLALRRASEHLGAARRWQTEPVRELVDRAMERFDARRTDADAWLAPRLHATVRMTRGEAADSRLWNFLAMIVAPDYVIWRHRAADGDDARGTAQAARFRGAHYTQTFSRLWWAAELFRDGPDYRPVETACAVQDVLQNTMRMDVIDHRPTAQAILQVVDNRRKEGAARIGDQVNALSAAVNAAGSTLVFDVLAPDPSPDGDALRDWIDDAEDAPPAPWDVLPEGPDDGRVRRSSVEALVPLFDELLRDASLRDRSKRAKVPKARPSDGVSLVKSTDTF
ncbi:DUF6339 family protein [Streptomyces toxytricini]|uniref:DUF6339 family protein n=1 Tax=Streptomyces toxytricini TaxID=67369 RepID=UPI00343C24A0